jgi:integrase
MVPVFEMLISTGADIGEVLTRLVRDIHKGETLTRIDLRRSKTDSDPRLVPLPDEYAVNLVRHVERFQLKLGDRLFGMFRRTWIENLHERVRVTIGRGTHREMAKAAEDTGIAPPAPDACDVLRIKDLRHVAAITWAKAGVRLERIQGWLGHKRIEQTQIYARFRPEDAYDAPFIERAQQLATTRVSAETRAVEHAAGFTPTVKGPD